jgi:hypothetical protein
MRKGTVCSIIFCLFFLGACLPSAAELTVEPGGSTPTTHPFFEPSTPVLAFPTVDPVLSTPAPTVEFTRPISETLLPLSSLILTTTIFDEETNSNWAIEASNGVTLNADSSLAAHAGSSALTVTGQPGGSLLFRLRGEAHEQYEREKVLAISFWLYSRENGLRVDDLVVQAFGSDTVFYWVRNDMSAILDLNTFSGMMLYGLGLNQDIPPEIWGKIEILLEALVYDPNFDDELVELPEYAYFTGFSINFTEGFEGTMSVDEVNLLTWNDQ